MRIKKLKKWKSQSTPSKKTIKLCKICFKEITDYSLFNMISNSSCLCNKCASSLNAKFITFDICDTKATAVYEYDEVIKKLIYTFKGCYDYELKNVFLNRYKTYLKMKYHSYIIVPAPSSEVDNLKRGYNHVVEIFKTLDLQMENILYKTVNEKQSSKSHKDRLNIHKIIKGKNLENITNKKVLLVDDIYTTGSTVLQCLEILKRARPKKIEVLLIAKTIDLRKREKNEY